MAAEDDNPDRLLSELPDVPNQHNERNGSISLGAPSGIYGDEVSPEATSANTSAPPVDHVAKAVETVTNSEIGVNVLLSRLKQSIASVKVRCSRWDIQVA